MNEKQKDLFKKVLVMLPTFTVLVLLAIVSITKPMLFLLFLGGAAGVGYVGSAAVLDLLMDEPGHREVLLAQARVEIKKLWDSAFNKPTNSPS